mgnify:CR=1 FL=1
MIRVFLVDDHAILRAGIAALISTESDMQCVGQAADGREALEAIDATDVDVALVDLEMPHCDGFKTIQLLGQSAPGIRTVALTMHQERSHVQAALVAGASAFVAKHVADDKLLQTIRGVESGSSFLCVVGDSAAAEVAPRRPMLHEPLSKREQQVLELLVLGHTNREIAQAISIGTKSVETYRSRIGQKLGLRTRAELVQYAIAIGLLQQLVQRFPDIA